MNHLLGRQRISTTLTSSVWRQWRRMACQTTRSCGVVAAWPLPPLRAALCFISVAWRDIEKYGHRRQNMFSRCALHALTAVCARITCCAGGGAVSVIRQSRIGEDVGKNRSGGIAAGKWRNLSSSLFRSGAPRSCCRSPRAARVLSLRRARCRCGARRATNASRTSLKLNGEGAPVARHARGRSASERRREGMWRKYRITKQSFLALSCTGGGKIGRASDV